MVVPGAFWVHLPEASADAAADSPNRVLPGLGSKKPGPLRPGFP